MGRRKKAEVTEMIETVDIIPQEEKKPKRKPVDRSGEYLVICKTKDYLNVRGGAGKDQEIVAKVNDGSKILSNGDLGIAQDKSKWLFVTTEDGTNGWCMIDFLKKL